MMCTLAAPANTGAPADVAQSACRFPRLLMKLAQFKHAAGFILAPKPELTPTLSHDATHNSQII